MTSTTTEVGGLNEVAYLDLADEVEVEVGRFAAAHGGPVTHVAFTVTGGVPLSNAQQAEVRRIAAAALAARLAPDTRPVADVVFAPHPFEGRPRVEGLAAVTSPAPRVMNAAAVDADDHGTEPLPVEVVSRLELTFGSQVRSANLGEHDVVLLGSNRSFAFRPGVLPLPGADIGVRVENLHSERRLRVTVVPNHLAHHVVVHDQVSGTTTTVGPGRSAEVGIRGRFEVYPVDGPTSFELAYSLETDFEWWPGESTVRRMVVRVARRFDLTSGEFRTAPLQPRSVTFRVRVPGEGAHEVREVPCVCVYAAGPPVPRAGVASTSFMKVYLFLNEEDRDLVFAKLSEAEQALVAVADHVVPVRHFRVGEGHGGTSVLMSAAGPHGDVEVPQDYSLACIIAVSPEVSPWHAETRCRLDQVTGAAAAVETVHAGGFVLGDPKPDNATLRQRATGGSVMLEWLDVDSVIRADSPVFLHRGTPRFLLPALEKAGRAAPTLVNPALLQANDHLGFVAVVVAALSGTDVAAAVVGGGAYLDDSVPAAVRAEVQSVVRGLRAIGLNSGPEPAWFPTAWLAQLEHLLVEHPTGCGCHVPPQVRTHGDLQKLLATVGPYRSGKSRAELERALEDYAVRWLHRTQLSVGSVLLFVIVLVLKGVLL